MALPPELEKHILSAYMPAILKALSYKASGKTHFYVEDVPYANFEKTYKDFMTRLSSLLEEHDVPNKFEIDYPYGGPSHGEYIITFL